jgi:phage terminase small subunit
VGRRPTTTQNHAQLPAPDRESDPRATELEEIEWERAHEASEDTGPLPFGLTVKQWRFVCEYFRDFNQTRAAERAGYSRKSAAQTGHAVMQRVRVQRAIEWLYGERARLYSAEHSRVLQNLLAIVYTDLSDVTEWDGRGRFTVKAWDEIPKHQRAAIRKVKFRERETDDGVERTMEVELVNADKSRELLMRAIGMLRETEATDNRGAFGEWLDAQLSGRIPLQEREADVVAEVVPEIEQQADGEREGDV